MCNKGRSKYKIHFTIICLSISNFVSSQEPKTLMNLTSGDDVNFLNSYVTPIEYYSNRIINGNENTGLHFRQIDFDPLNIQFKWCKKILFVNVCGTETKQIVYGEAITGKDIPGNETDFVNRYFRNIVDITAYQQPFSSNYALNDSYILNSIIVDQGNRQLFIFKEGLEPIKYGNQDGQTAFINPIAVKVINNFVYVLDKGNSSIEPTIKVIYINHQPDGTISINEIGSLDHSNFDGFTLEDPTDISGMKCNSCTQATSLLAVSDKNGLHYIELAENGLPYSSSVSTYQFSENPTNSNISYDMGKVVRFDMDENANTICITLDNRIYAFKNLTDDFQNTELKLDKVIFLNRKFLPSNVAYMTTEKKWYVTDYKGFIHTLSKDADYLAVSGQHGLSEGNEELYFPTAITPNPITDPKNDFRYRFIVANQWTYITGFKMFAPYITIPEIKVFENSINNKLIFTFTTSSKWDVVEKAKGVTPSKVLINGIEISSSLWNTQIIPTDLSANPIVQNDDLTSFPNVFNIDPSLLPNLNRGWNTVEVQLLLAVEGKADETITNNANFYWLPSQFTGTAEDYQFINSSTGIDFIYKPTTLSGDALLKVNQQLYVMEEGTLAMQENSTFFNPATALNDFSNIKFFSEQTSKISIEDGAYLCISSLPAPSGIQPPSTVQFALSPGYKTGKNPVITGLSSYCKSPCYALADDKPVAVVTAQAYFNTANTRYEAFADTRGSTYSNSMRYVIAKLDANGNETAVSATLLGVGLSPDRVLVNDLFPGFSLENQNEYKLKITLGCNSDQGMATPEWIESSTVTTIIGLKTELKLGDPQAFCERQTVGSITGFTPVSTLVGYTDSGAPKTGFWSGPGVNFAGIISITNDLPRNIPIDYVYSYTDELNFTQTAIKTITITSAPTVSDFGTKGAVCAGTSFNLSCVGTGIFGASKYYWSGPNNFSRVTTYPETYIQNPDISANRIYTVSLAGNGCVGDPATVTGVVYSLPGVSAGLDEEFCVGVADNTITGFSPEGGLWQGTGIVNSTSGFNTATSGAGVFQVNYLYTDANGCTNNATKNITVGPLINTGGVQYACKSDVAVVLTVASPIGGNWVLDGNTLTGGLFAPAVAGRNKLLF